MPQDPSFLDPDLLEAIRVAQNKSGVLRRPSRMGRSISNLGMTPEVWNKGRIAGGLDPIEAAEEAQDPIAELPELTAGDAWGEIWDNWERLIPYIASISEVSELKGLHSASKAMETGEATEEQINEVMAFVARAQGDKTFGYHVVSILGQLPAFIGEIVSGGALATKTAMKIGGKGLRDAIEAAGKRNITRAYGRQTLRRGLVLGDEAMQRAGREAMGKRISLDIVKHRLGQATGTWAATEAISGTGGLINEGVWGGRSGASAYRRALGAAGMHITQDEADELHLVMNATVDDFDDHILAGLGDSLIEMISERSGRELMSGMMAIPGVRHLEGMKLAIAKRWMKKHGATASQLSLHLEKAGWQGPVEEFLEERFGGALRSITLKGEDEFIWQREDGEEGRANFSAIFPDLTQMAAELAAFTIPGPAISGIHRLAQGPISDAEHRAMDTNLSLQQVQLRQDNLRRAIISEGGESALDDLRGENGQEARDAAWDTIKKIDKLRQMAEDAGIRGFRAEAEGSTTEELQEAQRFVDRRSAGEAGSEQARIVDPPTGLHQQAVDNLADMGFRVLLVEGGASFAGSGGGMFSRNLPKTILINPDALVANGSALRAFGIGGHEATHHVQWNEPALSAALSATIDDLEADWLDLSFDDYLTSFAVAELKQGDLREKDPGWAEALDNTKKKVDAQWRAEKGDGYEAFRRREAEANLLTPSARAEFEGKPWTGVLPAFVFLNVGDGAKVIEEMKTKDPTAIERVKDFFLDQFEKVRGKDITPRFERRLARLQQRLGTEFNLDDSSFKIAVAFNEAMSGILSGTETPLTTGEVEGAETEGEPTAEEIAGAETRVEEPEAEPEPEAAKTWEEALDQKLAPQRIEARKESLLDEYKGRGAELRKYAREERGVKVSEKRPDGGRRTLKMGEIAERVAALEEEQGLLDEKGALVEAPAVEAPPTPTPEAPTPEAPAVEPPPAEEAPSWEEGIDKLDFSPPEDTEDLTLDVGGITPVKVANIVTALQPGEEEPLPRPDKPELDPDKWYAWSTEGELLGVFNTPRAVLRGILGVFTSPTEVSGAEEEDYEERKWGMQRYQLRAIRDPARDDSRLKRVQQKLRDHRRAGADAETLDRIRRALDTEREQLGIHFAVTGADMGERLGIMVSKGSALQGKKRFSETYEQLTPHPNAINVTGSVAYEVAQVRPQLELGPREVAASQELTPEELAQIEATAPEMLQGRGGAGAVARDAEYDEYDFDQLEAEFGEPSDETGEPVESVEEESLQEEVEEEDTEEAAEEAVGGVQRPRLRSAAQRRKADLRKITQMGRGSVVPEAEEMRALAEEERNGDRTVLATIGSNGAGKVDYLKKAPKISVLDERTMWLGNSPITGLRITSQRAQKDVVEDRKVVGHEAWTVLKDGQTTVFVHGEGPRTPFQARAMILRARMQEIDDAVDAYREAALEEARRTRDLDEAKAVAAQTDEVGRSLWAKLKQSARDALGLDPGAPVGTAQIQEAMDLEKSAFVEPAAEAEERARWTGAELPVPERRDFGPTWQFANGLTAVRKFKRAAGHVISPGKPYVTYPERVGKKEYTQQKRRAQARLKERAREQSLTSILHGTEVEEFTGERAPLEREVAKLDTEIAKAEVQLADLITFEEQVVRDILGITGEVTVHDRRAAYAEDPGASDAVERTRHLNKRISNMRAAQRNIKDTLENVRDNRYMRGAAGSAVREARDRPVLHTVIIKGTNAASLPKVTVRRNLDDNSLYMYGFHLNEEDVQFIRESTDQRAAVEKALAQQNGVGGAKLTWAEIKGLRLAGLEVELVENVDPRRSGRQREQLLRNPENLDSFLEEAGAYLLEGVDTHAMTPAERFSFVLDTLSVNDERAQAKLLDELSDFTASEEFAGVVKYYHQLRRSDPTGPLQPVVENDVAMFSPPIEAGDSREELLRPGYTLVHRILEGIANRHLAVEYLERELERMGVPINRDNIVSLREALRQSQTEEDITKLDEEFVEPLKELIAEHDIDWYAAGEYLRAISGITRNRVLQPYIEASLAKAREQNNAQEIRHWAGLMNKPSGHLDKEWQERINEIKKGSIPVPGVTEKQLLAGKARWIEGGKPPNEAALNDLSKLASKMSFKVLDILVDAGLLDEVDSDTMKKQYPDYVPFDAIEMSEGLILKGAMTQQDAEQWMEAMGDPRSGVSQTGKVVEYSYGRATASEADALSLLIGRLHHAQARKKAAEVGQALLKLAEDADKHLGQGNHFMSIITAKEKNLHYLHPDGHFVSVPDPRWPFNRETTVVAVRREKEDGKWVSKKYGIKFEPGHQENVEGVSEVALGVQVARALNSANMNTAHKMPVIRQITAYTRLLSGLSTRHNPAFTLPNFFRDISQAYMNLAAQYGHKKAIEIINPQSVWRSLRIQTKIRRQQHAKTYDKERANPDHPEFDPDIALWERYAGAGGPIVFGDFGKAKGALDHKGDASYQNSGTALMRTALTMKELFDLMAKANDVIENGSRFAYFIYGLESEEGIPSRFTAGGRMDENELALGAKNLTVNFETKGTFGSLVNGLYMFANANIQSNLTILRALSEGDPANPFSRKMRPHAVRLLTQMVVGHMVLAMLNNLWGGEDEEDGESYWDKIPEYEKKTNIIFLFPGAGNGSGIKIPASYGYNIFGVTGYTFADVLMGSKTVGEAGLTLLHTALEALSPTGGFGSESGTSFSGSTQIMDVITPTFAKPILEINRNRDWKGAPIYKQRYGDMTIPNSQLYFDNVSPAFRAATDWLNGLGGNEFKAGSVDLNPSAVEYLFSQVTGGLGKFVDRTLNLAARPFVEEEAEIRDIPIVRRFAVSENVNNARNMYRDRRDLVYRAVKQYKAGVALNDEDRFLLRFAGIRRTTERKIKRLREARNKLPIGDKRRNQLDNAELAIMNAFNKRYHEATVALGM